MASLYGTVSDNQSTAARRSTSASPRMATTVRRSLTGASHRQLAPRVRVDAACVRVEADEEDLLELRVAREEGVHLAQRDAGRELHRESVCAGADGGEGDGAEPVLAGERERAPVAPRQELGLPVLAISPHRPDGVDDVRRREPVPLRDPGFAGRAAAERAALGQELGSGGAVDGAI